jgi:hypothetical protein
MPTKSGRVKLEDIRPGKTIWQPSFSHTENKFVPRAHLVTLGITYRTVGLVENEKGELVGYSLPMYSISKPRAMFHYNGPALATFHPSRNMAVMELPDGSLAQVNGFTSRRRCQRYIDDLEAGRIAPPQSNVVIGTPTREAVAKHAKPASFKEDAVDFNDLRWVPSSTTPDYSPK